MGEQGKDRAIVSKKVLELVPAFLRNRWNEVESLRQALVTGDFELVRHLGHRMRGVGGSYGFDYVTTLGRHLEQCGRERNTDRLGELVGEYADYLSTVRIEYA